MSNPFEVPSSGDGGGGSTPGDFEIALAFEDGWNAMLRNGVVWFGVLIVVGLLSVLSILACLVPAFVVVPLLAWGQYRFILDAVDGEASFDVVFKGFERAAELLVPMLGLFALFLLAYLPVFAFAMVQAGAAIAMPEQSELNSLLSVLYNLFSLGWGIVIMSRFVPSWFLIVERGVGPVEAFTESWTMTAPVWTKMMGVMVLTYIVSLVGFCVCIVGIFPASMVAAGAQASLYRQLTGTRVTV